MSIEFSRFDNRVWGELAAYEFQEDVKIFIDEKAFFLYLCHNERMNFFGLYPINKHQISAEIGMDRSRIEDCLRKWTDRGFLIYDNGLIFVPSIGMEQNIENDRYFKSILAKCLTYRKFQSEIMDSPNRAYEEFEKRYYDTIKTFIEAENAKHGKALHGELPLFTVNSTNSQRITENSTNSRGIAESRGDSRGIAESRGDSRGIAESHGDSQRNGQFHGDFADFTESHGDFADFTENPSDSRSATENPSDSRSTTENPSDSRSATEENPKKRKK